MEENPSGSLPSTSPTRAAARADQPWTGPTPHDNVDPRLLSDRTVRMPRVLPLSAVGMTNDQLRVRITDDGLPPFDPDQPIGPRNFPEVSTARGGIRFTGSPGTPVGRVRVEEDEHGIRPVPLEDDPEADPPGWWADVTRAQELEASEGGPIVPTLLEGVTLTGGTDPVVWWARRILYVLAVVAAGAAAIAWAFVLVSVVRIVWLELWL